MNTFPFIIVGIITGLILVGILVVLAWKKNKVGNNKGTNYRVLYNLGVIFLPLGVIYEIVFFVLDIKVFLVLGISFIAMGLSYLAIGLGNKDKWKSNGK